jgi:hypothetical protein
MDILICAAATLTRQPYKRPPAERTYPASITGRMHHHSQLSHLDHLRNISIPYTPLPAPAKMPKPMSKFYHNSFFSPFSFSARSSSSGGAAYTTGAVLSLISLLTPSSYVFNSARRLTLLANFASSHFFTGLLNTSSVTAMPMWT